MKTTGVPTNSQGDVPSTTGSVFKKGSEAPFSSDGMDTFAQAICEDEMDIFTDDLKKLTSDDPSP